MRCKVIVNPNSGRQVLQKNLEIIIGKLALEMGLSQIDITYTRKANDACKAAASLTKGQYDLLIGAGGDGTLNEIINGLMQSDAQIPLAMLGAGTINDFAYSLDLPSDSQAFFNMIKDGYTKKVDLGWANGRYFINVAAFGMFTDIPYKTKSKTKTNLGKLAYYLEIMRNVPDQILNTMHLKMEYDGQVTESEALVCIIANSSSVGGIRNMMSKAKVDDGLLDVLLIRKPDSIKAIEVLNNLFEGGNFSSALGVMQKVQVKEVCFTVADGEQTDLDVDGEVYGSLPLCIKVIPQAISLYCPAPKHLLTINPTIN